MQRGLAAGITIYAPAIILLDRARAGRCTLTDLAHRRCRSIVYTVLGGAQAVSQTQKHRWS